MVKAVATMWVICFLDRPRLRSVLRTMDACGAVRTLKAKLSACCGKYRITEAKLPRQNARRPSFLKHSEDIFSFHRQTLYDMECVKLCCNLFNLISNNSRTSRCFAYQSRPLIWHHQRRREGGKEDRILLPLASGRGENQSHEGGTDQGGGLQAS